MRIAVAENGQMLYLINYYDDRGRVIQTQQTNITGGTDITTTQYDFSGKPLRTLLKQEKQGTNPQTHTVLTKMSYDAQGRLLTLYKNVDNTGDQLIATNTYNELGQLQSKQLGNNLDDLAYDYNIRGWLKSINKSYVDGTTTNNYFGMDLGYEKATAGNPATQVGQYNGNIASQVWRSAGDGIARKYDYKYDNASRITRAEYTQNTSGSTWDASTLDFSVFGFDSDNGYGIKYDANGNILMMIQKGWKAGQTGIIDALRYTYFSGSNKLQRVSDDYSDPDTRLGDFHDGTNAPGTDDYAYDDNGNLVTDNNKGISNGVLYNYMNQPQLIHKLGQGYVSYTHDALGNKLSTKLKDDAGQLLATTLYLGPFVYRNDTLQFISTEEGRIRWAFHKNVTGGAQFYQYQYDFFERDHLGNTRVVLTQQKDTTKYLASGEAAFRNTESQLFSNLNSSVARTSASGYPNDVSITNPNDTVFRLNGNAGGHKMGPGLLLKVMSGDKVDIGVQYYYNSGTTGTPNSSLTDVLASLATGIVNVSSGGKGSLTDLNNTGASPIYAALNSFFTNNNPNPSGKPKAYLNWILLDEQLKYVSDNGQSGALVVGNAGSLATLATTGLALKKSGYLYIWVSNETPNWDVFFDNLSVKHYTGPLLEETHYYPFGLTIAGISSKALKPYYAENRYKYNGKELQNKEFSDDSGLEWYAYGMREYDPQIGRFFRIDPLAEKFQYLTPYQYASNNPIINIDLDGLEGVNANDINNPHIRAALRESVQKQVEDFNNKMSGAAEVKVTLGPGAGAKVQVADEGVDIEANGPQVSVSKNLGGDTKIEGSAAGVTVKAGAGKNLSAQATVKLGAVEVKNGKTNVNVAKSNVRVRSNTFTKTVGDNKASETVSANPDNQSLSVSAKAGLIGVEVSFKPEKLLEAATSFLGAIIDYTKEIIKENIPDTNGGYIDTHGKLR
jgi:RHS repeat-associated protein